MSEGPDVALYNTVFPRFREHTARNVPVEFNVLSLIN